jgi:hypothetical protein
MLFQGSAVLSPSRLSAGVAPIGISNELGDILSALSIIPSFDELASPLPCESIRFILKIKEFLWKPFVMPTSAKFMAAFSLFH